MPVGSSCIVVGALCVRARGLRAVMCHVGTNELCWLMPPAALLTALLMWRVDDVSTIALDGRTSALQAKPYLPVSRVIVPPGAAPEKVPPPR